MSNGAISPARVRAIRDLMLHYLYDRGGPGKLKREIPVDEIKKALNLSHDEYWVGYNNLQDRRLLIWPGTGSCIGINLEGQFEVETLGSAVRKASVAVEAEATDKQTDGMVVELLEMSKRMRQQSAEIQAEFDAYRARPWWRRIAG